MQTPTGPIWPNVSLKLFIEISALLTGFNQAELEGTGLSQTYLNTILKNSVKEDVFYFFQDIDKLLHHPQRNEQITEATIETDFMQVSSYGGIARQLIILWYTGSWNGAVISTESYKQGLMWKAGHTHPAGAKQPGFGSWANIPLTAQ